MPVDKKKSHALKPGAKDPKQQKPRKLPKAIEPFTEEDFELVLKKVTRHLSEPSQSDSAKK
jgi:hypothetical protein